MTLQEINGWSWEKRCHAAVAALADRGFKALYCADAAAAAAYILTEAADSSTVGFGGSFTIKGLGIAEQLTAMGKELLDHGAAGLAFEQRRALMDRQQTCDLFLSGTNALTISGLLVNIDGFGNRVAAMIYGPKKVIVVAGRNKLVNGGVEEAIRRIKTVAAPANAMRLDRNTPCAPSGFCADCDSPERICRVTTILDRRPGATDFHVLVVNADLGI